jgi:hypothetical protein
VNRLACFSSRAVSGSCPFNPGQNVMLLYRAKDTKQLVFRQVHEERFAL